MDHCRREIADLEKLILSGHSDLQGLCLALSDWWAELRILEKNAARQMPSGAAKVGGARFRL
jgi:hypothetical protein